MEREQHEREGREGVREMGGIFTCMYAVHTCMYMSV